MVCNNFYNKKGVNTMRNTVVWKSYEEYAWEYSNHDLYIDCYDKCNTALEKPILDAVLNGSACRSVLKAFGNMEEENERRECMTWPRKLKKLEDLISAQSFNNLNTYPVNELSEKTYNDFVGICQGKTTFNAVMKAASEQCKRMADKYDNKIGSPIEKTVLIISDKWNTTQFRKNYAVSFIHYAHHHNIYFIFLLVTDFGITRIPFSSCERIDLLRDYVVPDPEKI